MQRRRRSDRRALARAWAVLIGAALLCLHVSLSPAAAGTVSLGTVPAGWAVDHDSTLTGDDQQVSAVAAHELGRIGRGFASAPGPAGAVDLDVAEGLRRPGTEPARAIALSVGPVASWPGGQERGRGPPA